MFQMGVRGLSRAEAVDGSQIDSGDRLQEVRIKMLPYKHRSLTDAHRLNEVIPLSPLGVRADVSG